MAKTAAQKRRAQINRDANAMFIRELCEEKDFRLDWVSEYQARIDGIFDVYTTNNKWHDLKSGERGDFNSPSQLKEILKKRFGKAKKIEPLKPYIRGGYGKSVVVMRIPAGTSKAEAEKAQRWARNVAKKISSPTP